MMKFLGLGSSARFDLAIDLGTSNILISRPEGVLINEASCVALRTLPSGQRVIHSVGNQALLIEGRAPENIEVVRPLAKGVICEFALASDLMRIFMKQALQNESWAKRAPRVLLSLPYEVTPVEERAFYEACLRAGAREVQLIAEPVAAAIGMGIDIFAPRGEILVDVGAGTTEIVILSLGGVVASESIRVGGNDFDNLIQNFLAQKYFFKIGPRSVEQLKFKALNVQQAQIFHVNGFDKITALPRTLAIHSDEIRECVEPLIEKLLQTIVRTLEKCPDELSSDLGATCLHLSGGGSMIDWLSSRIQERTGLWVKNDPSPLLGVAKGELQILRSPELARNILRTA